MKKMQVLITALAVFLGVAISMFAYKENYRRNESTYTGVQDVSLFCVSDSVWYGGGENGWLVRSIDGGNYWRRIEAGKNIYFKSLYFLDTNRGFALEPDTDSVYSTNDGGRNWSAYKLLKDKANLFSITFVDSQVGFICGDNGSLFKTENAGIIWRKINLNIKSFFYKVIFMDKNKGFAFGENGLILVSKDSGESWEPLTSVSNRAMLAAVFVGQTGYAAGENGVVLKTADGGRDWQEFQVPTGGEWLYGIKFIDAENGFTYSEGNDGSLWVTRDGARTWQPGQAKKKKKQAASSSIQVSLINKAYFINDKTGYYFANDRNLALKTDDGGLSWRTVPIGPELLKDLLP